MTVHESDDIFRLYNRELVIVHTISLTVDTLPEHYEHAEALVHMGQAWVADNLAGRAPEKDIQFQVNTDGQFEYWLHVQVFKDNMKGEFKHRHTAEQFANAESYEEYVVVPRNSKADHDIRSYGIKKL